MSAVERAKENLRKAEAREFYVTASGDDATYIGYGFSKDEVAV